MKRADLAPGTVFEYVWPSGKEGPYLVWTGQDQDFFRLRATLPTQFQRVGGDPGAGVYPSSEVVVLYPTAPAAGPIRSDVVPQREVPPPKVVPDWPLPCPRCQKPQSAVLLFNGMDCRNGCFGRYR